MRGDTGGMSATTFASLFTGGGGADVGAMQAGLTPLWGVEYDPAIAAVAERNLGHPVTVADVLTLDPCDFEPVDVLHASPPCPNFSVAKAGAEETENDIALGRKVAEFVRVLRPTCFTLENVYGYRKAKSFRVIVRALAKAGYQYRWWHLNAADFGVPQTRKRLILVARLDGVPQRPHATHAAGQKITPLFDSRRVWQGWETAIAGIELPLGSITAELLDFYGGTVGEGLFNAKDKSEGSDRVRPMGQPSFTITTEHGPGRLKVVNGDIRNSTPRLHARLQSIPDSYELPENGYLACRIIGNAVPPLLMQRVLEAQQ